MQRRRRAAGQRVAARSVIASPEVRAEPPGHAPLTGSTPAATASNATQHHGTSLASSLPTHWPA